MKFLQVVSSIQDIEEHDYDVLYYVESTDSITYKQAVPPSTQIWYTTSNQETVNLSEYWEGEQPISNVYENGKGIMTFENPITDLTEAFDDDDTGVYENLLSVTMPNSVETIGDYAFYTCRSLTAVTIPNSVTDISDNAFNLCPIKKITYTSTKSDWDSVMSNYPWLANGIDLNSKVYCTDGVYPLGVLPIQALEFVDLGLPSGIKWANMNIGANSASENGKYFQWGATQGYEGDEAKAHSTWSTTPFNDGSENYDATYFASVSGTVCPNGVLAAEYDAATAAYGEGYRMPTKEDYQELYDNTTQEWVTYGYHKGYKFINKTDASKFIFVPASGNFSNGSQYGVGSYGDVWSSSLYSSYPSSAHYLRFNSDDVNPHNGNDRYDGFAVRGVLVQN